MNKKGLLHVIYGDGQGKTSSAVGIATRHLGRGGKILFAQFLKFQDSGETILFRKFENAKVLLSKDAKFSWEMTQIDFHNMKLYSQNLLAQIIEEHDKNQYSLIVLDEILNCLCGEILTECEIIDLLGVLDCEVILTGRSPSVRLIALADYAVELRSEKHPFDKGILAREGIDY